ncbi:hypothetical protein AQJ67_39130 [Streptomyces caeruleatus]|uniref:Uncharacterized protein n=1 Tax=Streptomyces caeruleatus TaxID=661399 RepID=A0A124I6I5_9ACTN|nr:hypothetical protein AQJ67_39130 [Streptomyces caeruleatus]
METNDSFLDLSPFLDSTLYLDLIERGGHASGPGHYKSAVVETERGRMSMLLGEHERMFSLDIRGRGFTWADGMTDDLRELVGAVAAWRSGMPVDEFAGTFPFMRLGRLARAHESGDPNAAQWEWLRTAEVYEGEGLWWRRPIGTAASVGSTPISATGCCGFPQSWGDRGRGRSRSVRSPEGPTESRTPRRGVE